MFRSRLKLFAFMTLCLAILAGCDSAEERAARHAERGAALMAAEDPGRAILEFRSALRLDDDNVEARLGYAHALEAVARPREAAVQYLALLDIDADHAVAHRDLALRMGDLDTLRTADTKLAETLVDRALAAGNADDRNLNQLKLVVADGRDAAAEAFLDAAIASSGGDPVFLGLKARQLEARGDAAGAIAIHEQLHARAPDDPVTANNLAALLAEHGDGEADLARAQTVARGLRGSRIPHFRDTYGWIMARRGDPVAALSYLEPAVRDLPGNPLVQAHLGLAYDAAGRPADAARAGTGASPSRGHAARPGPGPGAQTSCRTGIERTLKEEMTGAAASLARTRARSGPKNRDEHAGETL